MKIPLVPFSIHTAKKVAKPFYGFGEILSNFFPNLEIQLDRADLNINSLEYLSISLFSGIFWMIFMSLIFFVTYNFLPLSENFALIWFSIPVIFGFLTFVYLLAYPSFIVSRRIKNLERNMIYALRHLQIQIKSGVPLFDALVSVSNANYGLISEEFKRTIKKISTGTSETESLEDLALRNPSLYFRRIIWQINNSLRSGADLGNTLDNIVLSLSNEQRIAIRKYGSQLNPLAMMYMMFSVIIPTLGITFLLVISSFLGFLVTEMVLWIILIGVVTFQFFFIGIVKSRRPSVGV